jgi:glycosyltransferase involved in cell wall biosynthesis
MNVAVINLFDPLPGEPIREGRYLFLCRALAERGHAVHWYSSEFSHAFKRPRDLAAIEKAAREEGYSVTPAPADPYATNVSLARLRSHARTARWLADHWARETERPEAIVVSLPTPAVGRAAADWADRTGAPLIVDVQDLWPETFGRFWPCGLGWMNAVLFAGMVRDVRSTCQRASSIIGVARGYTDYGVARARPGTPGAMLPLGVNMSAFDDSVRPLAEVGLSKPPGERWLFLAGSLSAYVDVDAVLDLMEELRRRGRTDVRLNVVGTGTQEQHMRQEAARRALASVTFHGRQSDAVFMSMEVASDVALLPLKAGAYVFFPNRVFDFFAAALPVVSTVPGELADVLARHGAGVTCPSTEGRIMADAVERLLADRPPGRLPDGRDYRERRGAWVQEYDRREIGRGFARVIEETVARRDPATS